MIVCMLHCCLCHGHNFVSFLLNDATLGGHEGVQRGPKVEFFGVPRSDSKGSQGPSALFKTVNIENEMI